MSVELNHTIVNVKDRWAAARDVGQVLGLAGATAYGPFAELKLDNGVSLDFMAVGEGTLVPNHYAFLVGEDDFDAAMARIEALGIAYWADPFHERPSAVNSLNGGRGIYFEDPDGHNLELLTRG